MKKVAMKTSLECHDLACGIITMIVISMKKVSWLTIRDHKSLTFSPNFISILFPLIVSTLKTPYILTSLISNGYKFTDGHIPLV